MKTKLFILFFIFLMISGMTFAQKWQEITAVEDICETYPDEMKKMLGEFNLEYPGMEKVKTAWEKETWPKPASNCSNITKTATTPGI